MAVAGPGLGNYGYGDVYTGAGATLSSIENARRRAQQVTQPAPQQPSGGGAYVAPVNNYTQQEIEASRAERARLDEEALIGKQIDEAYNPAYANLNMVEEQYKAEYPTAQASIEQSYSSVAPEYQNAQNTQLAGIDTQRKKGKAAYKSQIGAARQTFNELQQGLLTRFGGASSTGAATQEILGRETSKQLGETNQNFADYNQQLDAEVTNVNTFFANKKAELEKEKQLKLQELKNTFDQSIRQINMQRATLDSEKAARRLAVLQEISAQARQVQYDADNYSKTLDNWKAFRDEQIQQAKSYGAKSVSIPTPSALGGGNLSMSFSGGGKTSSPTGIYSPQDLESQYGLVPTGYNESTGKFTYGQKKTTTTGGGLPSYEELTQQRA